MDFQIETYTMPEYIAIYAMYGEPIGDDDLESAYDQWLVDEMAYRGFTSMHLVGVVENGFMAYHELKEYGIGSCDTSEFVFHVTKEST